MKQIWEVPIKDEDNNSFTNSFPTPIHQKTSHNSLTCDLHLKSDLRSSVYDFNVANFYVMNWLKYLFELFALMFWGEKNVFASK